MKALGVAILLGAFAVVVYEIRKGRKSKIRPNVAATVPPWVYQHDLSQDVLEDVFLPDPSLFDKVKELVSEHYPSKGISAAHLCREPHR